MGRYALLLVHLLLLPVLQVVTEGHPRAEIISIAAEQVILVAAAGAIGGRRMLLVGVPLCVPGVATALAVVAGGEIPAAWAHVWAIARSLSFIVPIMTISLLILVDVLLLVVSFRYLDDFGLVLRNSGFVVATILLRRALGIEPWHALAYETTAAALAVAMLLLQRGLNARNSEQFLPG